jgi:hypothetical protein
MTSFFPKILIVLDVLAALMFAYKGEYVRCGYWLSAASINYFALVM